MNTDNKPGSAGGSTSRKVTVALHTRDHADRLRRLLEHEGVSAELVAARLSQKFIDNPIEVRISEDDLPAALRIIENIEIFPMFDAGVDGDADHDGASNVARRVGLRLRGKTFASQKQTQRTILVPVDFSDYSFTAARMAFGMASDHDAMIVLLYAYVAPSRAESFTLASVESTITAEEDAEFAGELDKIANHRMQEFAERLREYIKTGVVPAVKFSTEIVEGLPEEAILDYARNTSPMLIVMGTRGADKKESDMIGSVTAEVLDSCRSVAFTVPENMRLPLPADGLRQVAFLTNLDADDVTVLDKVHALFPSSPFNISLVYAGRKKGRGNAIDHSMGMLLDYCKIHYPGYSFEVKTVSGVGDIEEFERLQRERPVELMIIPNKRKNALARLFNPGLAHRMLFHCDIPMLVVPI